MDWPHLGPFVADGLVYKGPVDEVLDDERLVKRGCAF